MKLAERRLQTYINSSQWKKHKNCYFYPKLEGFKIMIVETEYGYYITLFYNYLQDNQPQQAKKHSNTKYENLIEAKKQIYYAITTGEMRKYLRKNGEPCPNDVLYNTDDDDIFDY